jgi:hypothetical protein
MLLWSSMAVSLRLLQTVVVTKTYEGYPDCESKDVMLYDGSAESE